MNFEALFADLAVEAHEQERVAAYMLLELLELCGASEEYGERQPSAVAVCEAYVDDDLAGAGAALVQDLCGHCHEIEALLVLQLQYRRDGCGGFGRHGEADALQQSRSA